MNDFAFSPFSGDRMFLTFLYNILLSSFPGSGLVGHVIRRCDALGALDCAQNCLAEHPVCKSVNFNKKESGVGKNCELNSATKSEHPQKLQPMKNVNYYETILKVRQTRHTSQLYSYQFSIRILFIFYSITIVRVFCGVFQ